MPTPPRLIAPSNAWRGNGSTPAPAIAPNSTALITLPVASAIAAMSKACIVFAAERQASTSFSASTRPSAIAIFSVIANTRLVEAISVVRSGVISPRWIARPASISSDAITISTSPGTGISASTGSCAASMMPARG